MIFATYTEMSMSPLPLLKDTIDTKLTLKANLLKAHIPREEMAPTNQQLSLKGVLKQEGAADTDTKPKKTVVFSENLVEEEPRRLSQPLQLSQITINDLEQANFREVWREVSQKRLEYAARVLQKFARKYMLCWIIVNDRRTDLLEELDDIDRMLQRDLERVQWEREDMMEESRLEVQAEMENAPPEEHNAAKDRIQEIKTMQAEIRELKQDNARMKEDCKKLKKENKQFQYDLKEKVGPVAMSEEKVQRLEINNKKIQANHDQFAPNIKKWEESLEEVNKQLKDCHKDTKLYKDTIVKIVGEMKGRCQKKKLVEEIFEILRRDFYPHMKAPESPRKAVKKMKTSSHHKKEKKKSGRRVEPDGDISEAELEEPSEFTETEEPSESLFDESSHHLLNGESLSHVESILEEPKKTSSHHRHHNHHHKKPKKHKKSSFKEADISDDVTETEEGSESQHQDSSMDQSNSSHHKKKHSKKHKKHHKKHSVEEVENLDGVLEEDPTETEEPSETLGGDPIIIAEAWWWIRHTTYSDILDINNKMIIMITYIAAKLRVSFPCPTSSSTNT
mgnify:CR=1 FL=1